MKQLSSLRDDGYEIPLIDCPPRTYHRAVDIHAQFAMHYDKFITSSKTILLANLFFTVH